MEYLKVNSLNESSTNISNRNSAVEDWSYAANNYAEMYKVIFDPHLVGSITLKSGELVVVDLDINANSYA